MIVIEEDVADALKTALSFAVEIWDTIDATQRISPLHLPAVCCLVIMVFGAREPSRPLALTGIQSTAAMANGNQFISIQRREFDLLLAISAMKSWMILITLLRRQSKDFR